MSFEVGFTIYINIPDDSTKVHFSSMAMHIITNLHLEMKVPGMEVFCRFRNEQQTWVHENEYEFILAMRT